MRKYAYLKQPLERGGEYICKIMLYKSDEGIYLFEYDRPDAEMCCADRCYDSLEELYEDWDGLVDERGWTDIGDPLPFCQHDAFIPIRVRGRDTGRPEWGKYETLRDGIWVGYEPR